jgi:hypothetical protein
MERRWCPDCRTRSRVVETFTDSHYESAGTMHYTVTALACGHDLQSQGKWTRDAPGAPYAGRPVASRCRPRDLAKLVDPFLQTDDGWPA